jgi:hypothetical protein
MPHAPIGERQLKWDHPQAEVDPRAKSNLAGKLSRLSILRIGFSVGTWSAMMLRMSNSISGSGMNISLALACGLQSAPAEQQCEVVKRPPTA